MQFNRLERRKFVTLLGGAAIGWPLAARAQQPERTRRVGILMSFQESDPANQKWLAGFQRRLSELGWAEDRNIRFMRRWAAGNAERIPALIEEIVGLGPDVILAQSTPVVAALRKRNISIPTVFVQVSDPVGDGFVGALANPGGNLTGFTNTMSSVGGKWLELLREAAPGMSRAGFLYNSVLSPGGGAYYMEPFKSAAASFGLTAVPLELQHESEIDTVIAGFAAAGGGGIVTDSYAFITVNRDRIITTVNRHRLPTIYPNAVFTAGGGLLSYGVEIEQQWQAAAGYIDRILRGEQPRNLPVQQPTKFVLVVNLKTAKAIGVTIPPTLMVRADDVIE
jgi:ABC-type uncharacterized transport system substrate-binding protein